MLIEHGANQLVEGEKGLPALYFSLKHGHVDIAQMLVERGTNVSSVLDNGSTAEFCTGEWPRGSRADGHRARRRCVSQDQAHVAPVAFDIPIWLLGPRTDARRARRRCVSQNRGWVDCAPSRIPQWPR
jgi:hypothetical protein